jgi:ribosome-binding ATPase YchF (GTP1/OBG family)
MLAKRLSGLSISEPLIFAAIHSSGLALKKPVAWTEQDILSFCKTLRKQAKPFVIAANKADLPASEANIEKIRQAGFEVVACASEAEALLRKAAKKGVLHYLPGDNSFEVRGSVTLNPQQQKALEIISHLIKKYGSTGVQEAINYACFKLLHMIAVYPVEDELKLADKKGNVLPDVRLLHTGSTAKDLAGTVHADLAKGFLYAIDARTKQRIGADHPLKNGDVIKIVSAASRG